MRAQRVGCEAVGDALAHPAQSGGVAAHGRRVLRRGVDPQLLAPQLEAVAVHVRAWRGAQLQVERRLRDVERRLRGQPWPVAADRPAGAPASASSSRAAISGGCRARALHAPCSRASAAA